MAEKPLKGGKPCGHPGCLSHVSHPCEGCGRVGGITDQTDQARAYLKTIFGPEYHRYIDTTLAGDFAVQVAELAKGFEKVLSARIQALDVLALKLGMSGEQVESLVKLCEMPLSVRIKKLKAERRDDDN